MTGPRTRTECAMRLLVNRQPADGPDKDEDDRPKDKDRGSNEVAGKQATC